MGVLSAHSLGMRGEGGSEPSRSCPYQLENSGGGIQGLKKSQGWSVGRPPWRGTGGPCRRGPGWATRSARARSRSRGKAPGQHHEGVDRRPAYRRNRPRQDATLGSGANFMEAKA